MPQKKEKRIGVLVGMSPLADKKAVEAIRMSVGLKLRDHEVYLLIVDEGVDAFLNEGSVSEESFRDYLEMHRDMGGPIVVERERVQTDAMPHLLKQGCLLWSRSKILDFLIECDSAVVIQSSGWT